MSGYQQMQVLQWLIYSISICFLVYILYRILDAFWSRSKIRENREKPMKAMRPLSQERYKSDAGDAGNFDILSGENRLN